MKRLLTYLLCAAFLFSLSGVASAVEKKKKEDTPKAKVQKRDTSSKTVTKTTAKKTILVPKRPAATKKKYDNFVDRNKNGVDDRRENLKQKVQKKPAAEVQKKPSKDSGSKKEPKK
ncbi:MAG TPA: hypothetical protein VMY05_04005 [Acidobacteriota bacterium]|nr:hypothetical protein [Acidobacteriota bacterium]